MNKTPSAPTAEGIFCGKIYRKTEKHTIISTFFVYKRKFIHYNVLKRRRSLLKLLQNVDELIAHMERKGIKFEIDSKETAREFLEAHNYYMKFASYRTNYRKHTAEPNAGKYINLDFAHLRELSSIDRDIRYMVMRMTLDIEHYLKVRLLRAIESNPEEDGYRLVQRFIARDNGLNALKMIQRHKSSEYCKGLIDKYYPYFPAWVYVELISLGELAHLCEFYSQIYQEPIVDKIMLNSVKDIRNAAAHSNCMINRLLTGDNKPHQRVKDRVKNIKGIGENAREKKLKNKFTYDFVCLMFVYDDVVPNAATKRTRYAELKELFEVRMLRHKDWFKTNNNITSTYDFCKKVLDNFL